MGQRSQWLSNEEFKQFHRTLPLARNTVKHYIKEGVDFHSLCEILGDPNVSRRDKKAYVYALKKLSEETKDIIWRSFIEKSFRKHRDTLLDFQPLYQFQGEN